ncbi:MULTISPECIES: hypothetical protein [Acinetobacter]|uniref:hypothetical protein n=1 Tax=Acinetobacter TaxID=469 RepID=UPI001BA78B59|nr:MULTISPECIES: hypothetical protein [Acinetobacter]MBZ6534159.1 hypothetical protein [Acinetobacter seifertii]MDY7372885.1 hypothetical protein [Acinetobacter oleivorans]
MSIEDFFIKDSPCKRYLLMSLALFMLIMALIAYFKGKLGFEYVFSLIAGYVLIFLILKNAALPLFPPLKEKSSDANAMARTTIAIVYILTFIILTISYFL